MINPWNRTPANFRKVVLLLSFSLLFVLWTSFCTVISFDMVRPTPPRKVDAVIVLGARVGTPALTYRTLTGLHYYQTGKTDTLVLSGAQGSNEPISEAQAMADIIKQEVAKTGGTMPRLILETRSVNTQQNLANSRALIPNASTVVVVSDGYHLARSVLIAKQVGFGTVYWNAPKPFYYATVDLAHYYVREAIALILHIRQLV